MKVLNIGGKEYKLEYSFEAAEHKQTVQKMFNIVSGAYMFKSENPLEAIIAGTTEMIGDIPGIVRTAFYSGLLENNPVSEEESVSLMRQYMKENGKNYRNLYDDIFKCMEDDGFFDLSGLTEAVKMMSEIPEKMTEKKQKKSASTK